MKARIHKGQMKSFLAIMAVVMAALLIQIAILTAFLNQRSRSWEKSVFEDYAQSLAKSFATDSYDIESLMAECYEQASTNDKVSGLLFHAETGEIIASYGFSRTGEGLPSLEASDAETTEVKMLITKYAHNEERQGKEKFKDQMMTLPVWTIQTNSQDGILQVASETVRLRIPKEVKGNQVTGIIQFRTGDKLILAVDVLTYNPQTYLLTRTIFERFGWILLFSAILSLLIAAVAVFFISRRAQRYTNGMESALKIASQTETDQIQLPKAETMEQISINNSIMRLLSSLMQTKKARKSWLRNLSHDLKTPVASIQLLLEGMADGVFPTNLDTVSKARIELAILSARLDRMSTFSNLEDSIKEPVIESFPASSLSETLKTAFDKKGSRLCFSGDQTQISANAQLITLALYELASNALSASDDMVFIDYQGPKRIEVRNRGTLPKDCDILDIWERGDEGRNSSGNGLGISIVQQVMRLHNGSLTVVQSGDSVVASMSW